MPKRTGLYSSITYRVFTSMARVDSYLEVMGLFGFKNRILGIYMMPASLITISDETISNVNARYATLTVARPSTINGYSPKNNKLFTYPFCFCTVSTVGQTANYLFERGFNKSSLVFYVYGVMGSTPKLYVVPHEYDSMTFNILKTIQDDYPQLPSLCAPFIELLGSNGIMSKLAPLAASFLSPQMSMMPVTTMIESETRQYTTPKTGQVVRKHTTTQTTKRNPITKDSESEAFDLQTVVNQIPSLLGTVKTDNFSYTAGDSEVTVATGLKKVYGITQTVKADEAEAIDNFFTMYGYACNKIKKPGLMNRQNWSYTKTNGCRLSGNIPGRYADEICKIFDNGITFWSSSASIGDYSGSNPLLGS